MDMDKELKQQRQATQLKRAHVYQDLYLDERFQVFKKEQLDDRLENLKKDILTANTATDEGRTMAIENIVRYQELNIVANQTYKLSQRLIEVYKREQEKQRSQNEKDG